MKGEPNPNLTAVTITAKETAKAHPLTQESTSLHIPGTSFISLVLISPAREA